MSDPNHVRLWYRIWRAMRFLLLIVTTILAISSFTGWLLLRAVQPGVYFYEAGLGIASRFEKAYVDSRDRLSLATLRFKFSVFTSIELRAMRSTRITKNSVSIKLVLRLRPIGNLPIGGNKFGFGGGIDHDSFQGEPLQAFERRNHRKLSPTEREFFETTTPCYAGFGMPIWAASIVLSVWPLLAFLRGPMRRWRRRRRNLCIHCGYNLTGNTTGRCSECGRETTKAQRHKALKEIREVVKEDPDAKEV